MIQDKAGAVVIRPKEPFDIDAIVALERRIQPYQPEHRTAVGAMFGRAKEPEIPTAEIRAEGWQDRHDIAELRRLRVDPGWRRVGIGTRLNETALDWASGNGFGEVVLNTTSAQIPALALYCKLGFQEIIRSFVGLYELVWMSRDL